MKPRLIQSHMEINTTKGILKANDLSGVNEIVLIHLSGKKPVECIVVRNKETIARLKTYKKHGTTPLGTAPLAIVVIADGQKSDVWVEDASIVSILIQLEAEKLGLGSTWIQLRRREGDGG